MNHREPETTQVAIACGGTGGHLFPGLAIAEQLRQRGCGVSLLVSAKPVDQEAVKGVSGMEIFTLPAVGLIRGGLVTFSRGFFCSYRACLRAFKSSRPQVVLAMGGFTSAPPVLAGRRLGAQTFLHESNTIPGRANRWLSWIVGQAFVGFDCAAARLHTKRVAVTGTPVREQFRNPNAEACRLALKLNPKNPVVLVMGGSQGASGINQLILKSLPALKQAGPNWQWLHLAGTNDAAAVAGAYAAGHIQAVVHPFLEQMELALGAADAAVSRAGASTLAELAAVRLGALLIPYPAATDNHQVQNALEFGRAGAARVLEQKNATPALLVRHLQAILEDHAEREKMRSALAAWDRPTAASHIAEAMLRAAGRRGVPGVAAAAASFCDDRPGNPQSPDPTPGSGPRVMKGALAG